METQVMTVSCDISIDYFENLALASKRRADRITPAFMQGVYAITMDANDKTMRLDVKLYRHLEDSEAPDTWRKGTEKHSQRGWDWKPPVRHCRSVHNGHWTMIGFYQELVKRYDLTLGLSRNGKALPWVRERGAYDLATQLGCNIVL